MITIYVDGTEVIKFGHATENEATRIAFPIAHTVEQFGSGTWQVINKRPGEALGYPVTSSQLETDENYLYWTLSSTDTQYAGTGECQLRYTVGDTIKLSYKWRTGICSSIVSGNAPTYIEAWLDELADIKDDAEEAADAAEEASEAIQDMSVAATSLPSTSSATVTKTVDPTTGAVTLTFGIPRGSGGGFSIVIVSVLPSTGADSTIYLVPTTSQTSGNLYDEYIYVNGGWEKIGGLDIDLTNYLTKSEASSTYLSQTSASSTYVPKTSTSDINIATTNAENDADINLTTTKGDVSIDAEGDVSIEAIDVSIDAAGVSIDAAGVIISSNRNNVTIEAIGDDAVF